MKKGQKCYIAETKDFTVKTGEFISRGSQWNYVLFPDGNVTGHADFVVFQNEADALKYILDQLKLKVIKDFKLPEPEKKTS